jgi:small subunit ribosomal protein S20
LTLLVFAAYKARCCCVDRSLPQRFAHQVDDNLTSSRDKYSMANTDSARKAARKIARRTAINKGRRSQMRGCVRTVEEAIAAGDRAKALTALKEAEPVIMRSAQKGIIHQNSASRKVSRLTRRIAKLGA